MRRNLQASIKAAQVSASSYTTTRSLKTAHGSAFPFSGQTQRPARSRARPECKVTVSRTACWSRLGSRCDHLARHGRTLHRNAGRVRRSKLARSPSSGDNIGLERPYPFGEELWLAESDFAVGWIPRPTQTTKR